MALTAGTRLGPYEILAPLGAGGMGEVYRARDARLARDVAVKVLPAALSSDPERLKRFEKEAKSASSLNHQNIVTIHDIGSEGGVSYIAMELVDGVTLRESLVAGPLPIKKLLPIAQQIADGLARAHEAGIVHRDLKPENVMVKRDGLVKILDFGLAKLTGSLESGQGSQLPTMTGTQPGVIVGTVSYMSPEQAAGETVDFRSDQFSFGSILYEMCTGRRAFSGRTAVDTLSAILNADPEPIAATHPQVPAPVRWMVERCLAKDARDRYSATDDLARDLSVLREHISEGLSLSGQLTAGTGVTRLAGGWRGGRLGALVAGVTLATALACGAAAWAALRRMESRPPPSFHQLTFRRGQIISARFAPDGHTILYSAAWGGKPMEVFAGQPDSPDYRPFGLVDADVLAVSRQGTMAVSLDRGAAGPFRRTGTLAQVSVASAAAPREILKDVEWADWSPDGKSLAIVRTSLSKLKLEYPAGKVQYETSGWVSHPRVSPTGDLVAFIDHPAAGDDGGSIATVDSGGRVKRLTDHFATAQGLAWSPDGEIWFTASRVGSNRSLHSVTLSGRLRERVRVPGLLTLQDIAPDGRILVTQETVRYEMVGLAPGETKERELTWLDYPAPAAMSADGKKVLFSETGEGGGSGYSVYIRNTDGSPAVRLGDGLAQDLSADGEWALVILQSASDPQLVAYPLGAGEPKAFPKNALRVSRAKWMPDDKHVLVTGSEAEKAPRIYLWSVDGGEPRAVVPEGFSGGSIVSPDGKAIVVGGPDRTYLYALGGGTPEPIRGLDPEDAVDQWSRDGRFLFVHRAGDLPVEVLRLDLATGKKQPWRSLMPADGAGVTALNPIPSPSGDAYIYSYDRTLSELYLVEGVR